jgi:3-methyladenine DNA glycosylase AlkD
MTKPVTARSVELAVKKLRNPARAAASRGYFKTGPGEYGEGDVFIGLSVPQIRQLALSYSHLSLPEIGKLLRSPVHELRLLAIILLISLFDRSDINVRTRIYLLYLKAIKKYVNNWDLIDVSAEHIVGAYLVGKPKNVLTKLARSKNVWERRVAMLATFHYIKKKQPQLALRIAKILVHDEHDLIQKAVGWMLREIGKRCGQEVETTFLEAYAASMPRTMLRYAIEKFPPHQRQYFLNKASTSYVLR